MLTRRFLPIPLLLALPLLARAEKPNLPKPALKALESANGILGNSTGDERVLACIDALPFLDIVLNQAPNYPYAVGIAAECRYLTDDFEKAVPLLEKYLSLVPASARQQKEVADKVEKAELRLMRAKEMLAQKQARNAPPEVKPVIAVHKEPPPAPVPAPEPVPEPKPAPQVTPPPAAPVTTEEVIATKSAPETPEKPDKPEAKPEAPKDDEDTTVSTALPPIREFAARAGYAPEVGVLGVGVELRLGAFALGVGTGGYPVGAGLSYLVPAGPGAAYAQVHAVWAGSSPFVRRPTGGFGAGATFGYDYRPVSFLSLRAGVGAADVAGRGLGLVFDLAAGPVLAF